MKSLASFPLALTNFVQEESRQQADNILNDKDLPRTSFSLQDLDTFSYKDLLKKFNRTNPLLVSSIVGTLSKTKNSKAEEISRKGFGGPNRAENVDLTPTVCQTVSRILKNRHPYSISTLPSLNSLYLWANRVPGQLYHLYNGLGDCFRLEYELGQAQVKLDDIVVIVVEVVVKAIVEVEVQLLFWVGGWVVG